MLPAERRGPFWGSPGTAIHVNKQMHNRKVPQEPGALGARGERAIEVQKQVGRGTADLSTPHGSVGKAGVEMNELEGPG